MKAAHSHGVNNTTLIFFYFQELLFLFALTYGMVLHK